MRHASLCRYFLRKHHRAPQESSPHVPTTQSYRVSMIFMPIPKTSRNGRSRLGALQIAVLICVGLAAGEFALRALPLPSDRFYRHRAQPTGQAVGTEFDDHVGWRHRPGEYSLVPFERREGVAQAPFHVTYWSDGSRASRASPEHPGSVEILLSGCSFVEGYGLGDQDHSAGNYKACSLRLRSQTWESGGTALSSL